MQGLFNKNKRKASGDDWEYRDRSSKHSKHNANDFSKSSIERHLIDVSHKTINPKSIGSLHAEKVASLLRSLEDVLDEEVMDATLSEEVLNRCTDLQAALLKNKSPSKVIGELPVSRPKSSQTSLPYDSQNIPKLVSPVIVTPWRSSTIPHSVPKLPEVLDPTLAAAAFIHTSFGNGDATNLSYERLEWVGDAYIELIATLLIAQTFPFLSPGKASQFREGLVKNVTLAAYARQYGFETRIRMDERQTATRIKENDLIKIQGDVFEAYVAAVILSDPANGIQRATDWLKDLWGQKLRSNIIHEERTKFKFDSPLWRLRGDNVEISVVDKSQIQPVLFKDQLQKSIGYKGVKIRYEDVGGPQKSRETKLAVFTVALYLDGWGEQGRLLGMGKGNGKKEAGERAAEMAMQNKKLIDSYMEKKKLAVAQAELEKQALEQLNSAV